MNIKDENLRADTIQPQVRKPRQCSRNSCYSPVQHIRGNFVPANFGTTKTLLFSFLFCHPFIPLRGHLDIWKDLVFFHLSRRFLRQSSENTKIVSTPFSSVWFSIKNSCLACLCLWWVAVWPSSKQPRESWQPSITLIAAEPASIFCLLKVPGTLTGFTEAGSHTGSVCVWYRACVYMPYHPLW